MNREREAESISRIVSASEFLKDTDLLHNIAVSLGIIYDKLDDVCKKLDEIERDIYGRI